MPLQRSFLLPALAALLALASLSLQAQQSPSGAISAQQAMQIMAGMREDLNLANARDKQLSLRLDALEEGLSQFTSEISRLRSLCTELAQQNQALETRMAELQKAMEADQKARREEWQSLTKDLSAMVRNAAPAPAPAPNVPTKELTIMAGDTLSSIAKAAKCTVAELMALNPNLKNADELRVGQVLRVPVK
ncbi:MAG: LysM peptidoglycan-binding domain-containing protein [Oligosphaeraceae bacterium]